MKPTISIITPSFNQGKFIERTIQSVLSQSIDNIEYFIADGGSSDETTQILRRYSDRIRWISEPDNGQADAVNKAIYVTRGDIIGWLNSDDIYYPDALKKVQMVMENHPELMVLYGNADHIDENDNFIESYYTEDWNYERLKEVCYLCQPAVFFRREVVNRFGMLNPNLQYCMDYEYWLRIGLYIPFWRVDNKLAASRFYPENKTLHDRMPVHKEINDMMLEKFGKVPSKWIFNYAHTVADFKKNIPKTTKDNIDYLNILIAESVKGFLKWKSLPSSKDLQVMGKWVSNYSNRLKRELNV